MKTCMALCNVRRRYYCFKKVKQDCLDCLKRVTSKKRLLEMMARSICDELTMMKPSRGPSFLKPGTAGCDAGVLATRR